MSRAVPILAALACLACSDPPPGTTLDGWERADAERATVVPPGEVPASLTWRPVEDPSYLVFRNDAPLAEHGVLWLRARVRCRPGWRDPVVFAPKVYVAVHGYVDGHRVGSDRSYREASGTPWYAFPLPEGCTEHRVAFRLRSAYTQIGLPEPPRAGERAEMLTHLVPRDLPRIAVAVVFLLIGLVSAVLAIGSRERFALIGLALYGLGLTGWSLFHTRTKQLWLPALDAWFGVWWVSVPLISTGVAVFLDAAFGPGPYRLVRALWIALAGVTVAAALSLSLGDGFFVASVPIFLAGRLLSLLGTVVVVAHLGRLAWRGDREATIVLVGIAIGLSTALRDFALSFHLVEGGDTWTQYGYAALALALIVIVRRRIAEMQRQLAAYADSLDRYVRERDALMKDLHDGLGGIVTNVRMLAERGRRADDATGVMASIARLASDGITELRTLIFGFEGVPRSWRQVGAELRRAGGTALEAHGVEHHFDLEVATDAPRPELEVVVHVMRVHREAVTNAVKHAEPERVDIRLRVTAGALELSVEDDGGGAETADEGVGMSRGLASMRDRAAALGGSLDLTSGDAGTRVVFRVPLARAAASR